jgi:predicted DNA-binding antitoxin AbrB/MazE fold protein
LPAVLDDSPREPLPLAQAQAQAQASVIFLRIRNFASLTPTEKGRQHERLIDTVRTLVPLWPDDARAVLETADGAAILSLDDPALALEAAERAAAHPGLAIGLHHGPVHTTIVDGQTKLTGPGIDGAHTVAGLSAVHPLLATSQFRQALLAAVPEGVETLRRVDGDSDAGVRSLEIYTCDARLARSRRRRRLLIGGATLGAILGLGLVTHFAGERYGPVGRPASVQLAIKPVGEVWLDGELKGSSPPLTRMWIRPGAHIIEIRNGRFKPLRLEVDLKPGEELEITHVFSASGRRSLLDRLKSLVNP